jgi:hypothetical protein
LFIQVILCNQLSWIHKQFYRFIKWQRDVVEPHFPKPLFHKWYSKKVKNKWLYWKQHPPSKTCLVAICINSVNNKSRIYKHEPPIELVSTCSQRCYNRHLTFL